MLPHYTIGAWLLNYCFRFYVIAVLLAILSITLHADHKFVSHTVLPNGMKVIVREGRTVNLAALDIWVKAGSINENEYNNGISHFIEHLIFKATDRFGPGEIDREIEGLGAMLNGGTSKDWVHFYTTVASEHLPIALNALADAIVNPLFNEKDIEIERKIILDEIARADSDPSHRAFRLFAQTAFSEHPYKLSPMGNREAINRLTRYEIVSYYKKYYIPENTIISIAGDISSDEAIKLVQNAFRGFENRAVESEMNVPAIERAPTSPRVQRFSSSNDTSYIVFGYHAPSVADFKEMCVMDVILILLGKTNRGRVANSLTNANIKFGKITSDFITQRHPSTISVLVSSDSNQNEEIISLVKEEFLRLNIESVPVDELEYAKRVVEGNDLFEQETFSGQARVLGLFEAIASYEHALKYRQIVRTITPQDVISTARKYFGENNYCLAVVE